VITNEIRDVQTKKLEQEATEKTERPRRRSRPRGRVNWGLGEPGWPAYGTGG
jgi:hypothetical protein